MKKYGLETRDHLLWKCQISRPESVQLQPEILSEKKWVIFVLFDGGWLWWHGQFYRNAIYFIYNTPAVELEFELVQITLIKNG